MIRISAVSYINTWPFIYGLQHSEIQSLASLSLDTPAECSRKLKNDAADIGLIPIATIPQIENAEIVSEYCIGAVGAVKTVLLLSQCPPKNIHTIYLDPESRTSVRLAKVISKHFWKKNYSFKALEEFQEKDSDTAGFVLIGDKTFAEAPKYRYRVDLAEEWQKFTGLPFVFACWVANKKIDPEFLFKLNEALKLGVDNISKSIQHSKTDLSEAVLIDYLTHFISYPLDDQKKLAMEKFLSYSV